MAIPSTQPPASPRRLLSWTTATLVMAALGVLWTTACTPMTKEETEKPEPAVTTTADGTSDSAADAGCEDPDAKWSYEGTTGPEHWADLSQCFTLCEAGDEQSPIDLKAGPGSSLPELSFHYAAVPLRLRNNGHTIQVEHDRKSTVDFAEMSFKLRQLHFHSPSEHTRKGTESPLEMHLVHASNGGSLTVVGVFIEPGKDNPALAALWQHLPQVPGDLIPVEGVALDTAALLPADRASYRYDGSLTTPPCGQKVRWIVLDEPITLSQEKIDAFRALYDGNRRPVQPLGDRQVANDL